MKQKTVKIDMQKAAGVGYKIDWHSTWASSSHDKTAWNIPLSQEPGRVENQNITGNFTPSLLSLLALLEPGHSWGGGTHLHFPPHLLLNELHWGGGCSGALIGNLFVNPKGPVPQLMLDRSLKMLADKELGGRGWTSSLAPPQPPPPPGGRLTDTGGRANSHVRTQVERPLASSLTGPGVAGRRLEEQQSWRQI